MSQHAHAIDAADIQGNILRGYNLPVARHAFYRVVEPVRARALLALLLKEVTTAEDQRPDGGRWSGGSKPHSTLNLAFTFGGLAALEVSDAALVGFPSEFRIGMRGRARVNVDHGPSAPEHWDGPWQRSDVHVAILINAPSERAVDERFADLSEKVARVGGMELIATQQAEMKTTDDGRMVEQFGYVDGFGNPDIRGAPGRTRPGRGKLMPNGTWERLAPGEFLLGQVNETGEVAATPTPRLLFRNGTFMVYRKLHQNIATFRRFLAEEGEHFKGGPELLAAKLVGRWRDGTPIMLSPDHMDASLADNDNRNTDFGYASDPNGARCPLGAHIRRANPRDALGFDGLLVNKRRMIRRGIPYGEYTPEGEPGDDTGEHGLIFIAFVASIAQQFEFVQQQWINYGNDFRQGNDKDPLIGSHVTPGRLMIPGDPKHPHDKPTHLCWSLKLFVETRGGDYFFMPSLTALRLLTSSIAGPPAVAGAQPELRPVCPS